jgi:tRNA dimethylallyltransferase
MALAQAWGAEIVACDSIQVYTGCDIGSAKPTADEQARVAHHLIDVVAPQAPFDAQTYSNLADRALADIAARGHPSIVCGGTGLYLRALRYGLLPTVPADPAFRSQQMAEETQRPGTLYSRLQAADAASAAAIGPHNKVQLLRALEITCGAGQPASVLRAQHQAGRQSRTMRLLQPIWPAEQLRARMAARIDAMLHAGLVEEVEHLRRLPGPAPRALTAVGYREVGAYLDGGLTRAALPAAMLKSTWAYARRQRTWLRREAGVIALPMAGDAADVQQAAARLLQP